MRDWNQFFTFDEINALIVKSNTEIHETINAKIREALEAAPRLYQHLQLDIWCEQPYDEPTLSKHTARLVAVKPIEKGET